MLIRDKLTFLKLLTLLKMATGENNKETMLAQIDINNKMQDIKYIESDCETPSR